LVTYILTQLISYEFILCCTCYDKLSMQKNPDGDQIDSPSGFVEQPKKERLKIVPICPYTMKFLKNTKNTTDF
ncbi:hypothetical protein, partial [Peptostreptococcus anaerobius]|uniref:hypothetical protein n=1 Tax=Peptostreptococcus anaerobius TaxID=1261 RepID=UPI00254FE60F